MKKYFTIGFTCIFYFNVLGQQNLWNTNILNDGTISNQFGSSVILPIAIFTGNTQRAFFN